MLGLDTPAPAGTSSPGEMAHAVADNYRTALMHGTPFGAYFMVGDPVHREAHDLFCYNQDLSPLDEEAIAQGRWVSQEVLLTTGRLTLVRWMNDPEDNWLHSVGYVLTGELSKLEIDTGDKDE